METNGITPEGITDIVTATHAANKKVLICIGGAGSYFPNAASDAVITNFVSNLTAISWRATIMTASMSIGGAAGGFRRAAIHQSDLPYTCERRWTGSARTNCLTSALPPTTSPWIAAAVENKLDQINIMTYDLSGPYPGWVTWYNSAIYNAGQTFPSVPDEYLPSIDGCMTNYLTNGIAAGKMGIGMAFYGYIWQGGNGTTNGGSVVSARKLGGRADRFCGDLRPVDVLEFSRGRFSSYDTAAQATYISVSDGNDGPSGTNDMFISYDDARACQSKHICQLRAEQRIWGSDHLGCDPGPYARAT